MLAEQLPRDSLHRFREKALSRALSLGMPTSKDDFFKKVSLNPLLSLGSEQISSMNVDISKYGRKNALNIYLLNGSLLHKDNLSSLILDYPSALDKFSMLINNSLQKHLVDSKDFFSLIALAIHKGLFIYIPKNLSFKEPLHITLFYTEPHTYISPRVQVVLGEESSLELSQEHVFLGRDIIGNAILDLSLGQGSICNLSRSSRIGPNIFFDHIRASLKGDSKADLLSFSRGSPLSMESYRLNLLEKNSAATLSCGYSLDNQSHHVRVSANHMAMNTQSSQLFKGLHMGKSFSSIQGKIEIDKPAIDSNAYQLAKGFLYDPGSHISIKPILEIFTDQVKASHGATVTRPNEEEILYMRSRGISYHRAKALLARGFLSDIVNRFGEWLV